MTTHPEPTRRCVPHGIAFVIFTLVAVVASGCATRSPEDKTESDVVVVSEQEPEKPPEPERPAETAAVTNPVTVQTVEPGTPVAAVAPRAAPASNATTDRPAEPRTGRYIGYTAAGWDRDFGVTQGRCDGKAAAEALGGGASVHTVSILTGAAIESKLATSLRDEDRACLGHTLELARVGQTVSWTSAGGGRQFRATPTRHYVRGTDPCREFTVALTVLGKTQNLRAGACRMPGGNWESAS